MTMHTIEDRRLLANVMRCRGECCPDLRRTAEGAADAPSRRVAEPGTCPICGMNLTKKAR